MKTSLVLSDIHEQLEAQGSYGPNQNVSHELVNLHLESILVSLAVHINESRKGNVCMMKWKLLRLLVATASSMSYNIRGVYIHLCLSAFFNFIPLLHVWTILSRAWFESRILLRV